MSETAMPDPVDAEFVTIAEAARRLGVDPRQVRRWLLRLDPTDKATDKERTHKGQPIVRVRLSAVQSLKSTSIQRKLSTDTLKGPLAAEQRTQSIVLSVEEWVGLRERAATVGQVVAERDALREALTREQETAAKLADRLADADARLAAVLVRQLPAADTGAGQDAASASQEPESGAGEGRRGEGVGDRSAALYAAEAKAPGFWAWLRGRGR